jgi:NAD-dependent deacetylase
MKRLVVLSGAGISAESGIMTFRDMGGLWQQYDITQVASPDAWQQNPQLVLDFYNQRRRQLAKVKPNKAHKILAELEKIYDVSIITQNVDNLHERAGSTNILHLHGELTKVRSTNNPQLIYDIAYKDLHLGDIAEDGAQLRPHIVWFGETVPGISNASEIVAKADIFLIIGTSLVVYPAAGLVDYVPEDSPIYLIDPNEIPFKYNVNHIKENAVAGMEIFSKIISN